MTSPQVSEAAASTRTEQEGGMTLEEAMAKQSRFPEVQTRAEYERTQAVMQSLENIFRDDGNVRLAEQIKAEREKHAAFQQIKE